MEEIKETEKKHYYDPPIEVKGWVGRYDKPGLGGLIFLPGCFDTCDGLMVPVLSKISAPRDEEHIIGVATLKVKPDGLYMVGMIHDKPEEEPNYIPFYANNMKKKLPAREDKTYIETMTVRCLSFGNLKIETSYVEQWGDYSGEKEELRDRVREVMHGEKKLNFAPDRINEALNDLNQYFYYAEGASAPDVVKEAYAQVKWYVTYQSDTQFALAKDLIKIYMDEWVKKDLQETVRCKDCRHNITNDGYCHKNARMIPGKDWKNWYCADAERRKK